MAAEHIAALDAGTSGVRCVILRPGTGIVAAARRGWVYDTPQDGGPLDKAFDAATFWTTAADACRGALADAGLSGSDIAAVGVTSQRLGIVVVDAEGRALLTSPNVDARAFMEGLTIDATMAARVYASTGKLPSLLLAPARLQWLRKHDLDAYARAAHVLTVGDWLAYQLTGVPNNERSLAADCGLLDVSTGERNTALLDDLDVPERLLGPLVSSSHVAGTVSASATSGTGLLDGTPVVIAGGDTQCALLGMGIESHGEAGIAAGWSAPVCIVVGRPTLDPQRRTWTDVHVVSQRWLIESSPADAGRVWHWWCETLLGEGHDVMRNAGALAAEAAPGSAEVLALLGPAPMNAGAMGLHLGGVLMTTPTTGRAIGRAELLRAVLENIAFAMRANLEQAEEVANAQASRVAVGGGLTQAEVFVRLLTDVLARPVQVAQDIEVTARGAAIAAARACGLGEASLRAELREVAPDAAASEGYQKRYERWCKLGPALDKAMQELT